ncbi:glycosyltransferase [Helicobacter apodemus]|nr:glycosyltransferase [Helicobacter apodemus]
MQQKLFGRNFDFLFFSIRAFKPFYQQREIVEAFIKYFGKQSNIGLLLPTFNQDIEYFKEVSSSFTPNIFIYNIPHSQMHNYLFAVDCVISYSKSDGISQSLMESLCAKKWIIANKLPNHSMFLKHKENAYLVDNIEELQEAFVNIQRSILKPYYDEILDCKAQKKRYLSILKEYFNVA